MKKTRKIVVPIPGTLDWELLRRFNIITHSTSFGEAAEKIGTSQQALLRHMDDLEDFLGQKLFATTAKYRSMELTPEGKTLSLITEQMVEVLKKQIIKNIKQTSEPEKKSVIRIITTLGLASTFLPEISSVFLNENKNTRIELIVKPAPQKINLGEISIRHDVLSQPNIKSVWLANLKMEFYASKEYLEKNGYPNSPEDLTNHQLLSFRYFHTSTVDIYTRSHNRTIYLEPLVQADFVDYLVELALRHHGILELPNIHPATKLLRKIPFFDPQSVDIYAAYLDVAEQESIIYEFVNFLVKRKEKDDEQTKNDNN